MTAARVSVGYGPVTVVRAVDVVLRAREVTVLVGPNGSGKSTLLRGLARLHPLQGGDVRIGTQDLRGLSGRELACRLALLTQGRPAPSALTVREVVAFGRHPHRGRWGRLDDGGDAAIERALCLTGLTQLADRDADTLSGGQAQRVWLAACLAQDTDVLLLDEPTTYLDLRYQVELLHLVRALADEHAITVGLVLHDLNSAADVADQLVLLDGGEVVARGTPAEVLQPHVLSRVYQLPVDVAADARTGALTVSPRTRLRSR